MAATPDAEAPRTADDLRGLLRRDLTVAMRARDGDAVRALRTALGAIDNAEAVESDAATSGQVGEHVAGASAGLGSSEAARRELGLDDVRVILAAQVQERTDEAEVYVAHGRADAAATLRAEAAVLRGYLDALPS